MNNSVVFYKDRAHVAQRVFTANNQCDLGNYAAICQVFPHLYVYDNNNNINNIKYTMCIIQR